MIESRKYGLLESDLNGLISVFKRNQKINKIILFGSRAKGNFENGSDIDITLVGIELKLDDILNAKIEIEKLSLPYKFDIILFDRIKEVELLEHIERVGIILYER